MATDKKQVESGTQRWLRIATLTLTVLGPVLNNVAARLGERLEPGGKRTKVVAVGVAEPNAEQEKAPTSRPSLSETFLELKDRPYSQELLKRGEALVEELEELVDRGSKLSQSLVTRSGEVTRELVERGSKASQDLVKRSEEARKELGKRGKKLNKELNKRSRKVAQELSERSDKLSKELSKRSRQATRQISSRSGTFWTLTGFTVGLIAATIVAYVFIRQRVQQQQELEEAQSFQLAQNGYLNLNQKTGSTPVAGQAESVIQKQPTLVSTLEESIPAIAVAEQGSIAPTGQSIPTDSAFVGMISTKRYYPVSTPLDQLASPENGKVDVIYFSSEEEAKAQGYTFGS